MFAPYIRCIQASGGEALLIPPGSVGAIDRVDGLLLVGGEDLAAKKWWSEGEPHPPLDAKRDAAELSLCERARYLKLPVLGICRGAQLMNCVLGGSVASLDAEQIAGHFVSDPANSCEHAVRIAPETELSVALSGEGGHRVVSRHTCCIAKLGKGLQASAWAEDGTIEAIESMEWPFLGLQWHPEWHGRSACQDLRPFQWLVESAQRRRKP